MLDQINQKATELNSPTSTQIPIEAAMFKSLDDSASNVLINIIFDHFFRVKNWEPLNLSKSTTFNPWLSLKTINGKMPL